jgi:uncharacterized lipoprotein YehR (DUF1307 family)
MKKLYVLLMVVMVLLFTVTITGCDRDECPICHECECVCIK